MEETCPRKMFGQSGEDLELEPESHFVVFARSINGVAHEFVKGVAFSCHGKVHNFVACALPIVRNNLFPFFGLKALLQCEAICIDRLGD